MISRFGCFFGGLEFPFGSPFGVRGVLCDFVHFVHSKGVLFETFYTPTTSH